MIRRLSGKKIIRALLIPLLVLSFTACKIRIVVPDGGQVISESGAYTCNAGTNCNIQVVDVFFDETFIAEPGLGYYFRRWKGGDRTFCGDTFDSCRLATTGFPGHAALEKILESDEVFFLRPLFAEGSCEYGSESNEDVFGNIYLQEGLSCKSPDQSRPSSQGLVKAYKNTKAISEIEYDQGRIHGKAKYYFEDGITLEEVSEYRDNRYDGTQKKYDAKSRMLLIARWQQGKLQGKSIAYDYSRAEESGGAPIVLESTYEDDKLNGTSTFDYPDGAWESKQWADGVQYGEYQVYVPDTGDEDIGWRTVYTFADGLIKYGYSYLRTYTPGTDDYQEQGGPDGPWVWECVYTDGVLDQEDCFKDSLVPLEPRI